MTAPKVEIVETTYGNFLVFAEDFDIAEQLRQNGVHDLDVVKAGIELLKSCGNRDTVIDVGAHLGTFSIPIAAAIPCKVRAFEAQRQVSHLLGANFAINGIQDAWVYNVAVGGPGDPAFIDIPLADFSAPGNFGAFSVDPGISERTSAARMKFREDTDRVETRTIDSCGFTGVGLIKIDVEGVELAVLRGAEQTIVDNGFPPIIFEAWTTEDFAGERAATIAFVEQLGYETEFHGENVFARYTAKKGI